MISIKEELHNVFFCVGEQHMQAAITWFVDRGRALVLDCALLCDDCRLPMANNT
jgi:hypothetical protein